MKLQRHQIIVRVAAILTVLLAFAILVLFGWMCGLIASSPHRTVSQGLGIYALLSIIPLMFFWGARQAWRFATKGIVSVYTSWFVFGLTAAIVSIYLFFNSKFLGIVLAAIAACAFAITFLVIRQEKHFRDKTNL